MSPRDWTARGPRPVHATEAPRNAAGSSSGDLALGGLVAERARAPGLTELKLDPHHGLSVVAAPLPPVDLPRPGEDAVCLASSTRRILCGRRTTSRGSTRYGSS